MESDINDLDKIKTGDTKKISSQVLFSFLRVLKALAVILILFLLGFGSFYIFTVRSVEIFLTDHLFQQREHYLTCYELPFYPQVQQAYLAHASEISALKNLGAAKISAVEDKCSQWSGGLVFIKGDILISADNNSDRKQIEKYLGKDFFGIPYRDRIIK